MNNWTVQQILAVISILLAVGGVILLGTGKPGWILVAIAVLLLAIAILVGGK